MNGKKNILTVQNIVKHYKDIKAVDGITLNLQQGECLALLGPNGAGKTTTCEMLEGLITPDSGEIEICGFNYSKNRKQIQELMGVQLQETSLYKRYSVLETLQLFASFYKNAQDPHQLIQELGLTEKMHAKLKSLSGGQKQRVYLACALINNPQVLFLDEPTTGLDPQSRRMVWESVELIKQKQRSIILTTHYMEEAERLADRVAIIDKGKIIVEGTPKDLIKTYCKEGLISISFNKENHDQSNLKKLVSEKLPWFDSAKILDHHFDIATNDAGHHVQELTRTADSLGIKITTLSMRQGSLEDVFLHFTGRSISND